MKTYLQWNQSVLAKIYSVLDCLFFEIPEVNFAAIFEVADLFQIKAGHECIGCSPFAGHHDVMTGLIPEVIVELHATQIIFPSADDFEILVQVQKATGRIAFRIT